MKRLVVAAGLALSVAVLGAAVNGSSPGTSVTQTYPAVVLSEAAVMTQQMSAPAGVAPTYRGHVGDEQLRLSTHPGFVRQLEAYQTAVDRMLARTP